MTCSHCGASVSSDADICPVCGTKQKQPDSEWVLIGCFAVLGGFFGAVAGLVYGVMTAPPGIMAHAVNGLEYGALWALAGCLLGGLLGAGLI